jgi:hypothetical protein
MVDDGFGPVFVLRPDFPGSTDGVTETDGSAARRVGLGIPK